MNAMQMIFSVSLSIAVLMVALVISIFLGVFNKEPSKNDERRDILDSDEWNQKHEELFQSSPIKVLVVEDNQGVSRSIAEMLMIKGVYVKIARNGLDAMTLLLKRPFDLITTGLNMPGINGIDFLNSIKKDFPKMKMALISACLDEDIKARAREAGAFKCLKKPFLMSEIYELVDEAAKDLGLPVQLKS
jgi:CheY-like chemotaxis protein